MASPTVTRVPFVDAFNLTSNGDGNYSVQIPASFCFDARAHGGYLISLVQRAATLYTSTSEDPRRTALVDTLDLKTHFFRPASPGDASIRVCDIAVGKAAATVDVRLEQKGKLCVAGMLTLGNFGTMKGPTLATNWQLEPAAPSASVERLARDAEPNWISYQPVWNPRGYRRPQSYIKWWMPHALADRGWRDHWIAVGDYDAGSDAASPAAFHNWHLGFVGDMTLPLLDNMLAPDSGAMATFAHTLATARHQLADREAGRPVSEPRGPGGAFTTPVTSVTASFNMEVKKALPAAGAKFLFLRSRARQVRDGRMDNEITIMDESGDLVAVVQQVHQVLQLGKARVVSKEPSAKEPSSKI